MLPRCAPNDAKPCQPEIVASARSAPHDADKPLQVELLTSFESLQGDWDDLAAKTENVFATYDWTSLWWEHFGAGRPLLIAACRSSDGRLRAILPCTNPPDVRLRSLGSSAIGRQTNWDRSASLPIVPERLERFAEALDRSPWRWDFFVAELMPKDTGWAPLLGARVLTELESPIVRFEHDDWDAFLAGKSSHFRAQSRRNRAAAAARDFQLSYRLATETSRIREDIETMFRLHAKLRPNGSAFFSERAFHTKFALTAHERGWLRLWFLELNGQEIAVWYGFRYGGAEFSYQSGRDPSYDKYAVGRALVLHSIREALHDGLKEYRFLRGGEDYKSHLANDPGTLETAVIPHGPLNAALARAAPIASRWRRGPLLAWYRGK